MDHPSQPTAAGPIWRDLYVMPCTAEAFAGMVIGQGRRLHFVLADDTEFDPPIPRILPGDDSPVLSRPCRRAKRASRLSITAQTRLSPSASPVRELFVGNSSEARHSGRGVRSSRRVHADSGKRRAEHPLKITLSIRLGDQRSI